MSYDQHGYRHSLCNAHLLRDLKYVHEEAGKPWAGQMIEVLLAMKQQSEAQEPDSVTVASLVGRYRQVLARGFSRGARPGEARAGAASEEAGAPEEIEVTALAGGVSGPGIGFTSFSA